MLDLRAEAAKRPPSRKGSRDREPVRAVLLVSRTGDRDLGPVTRRLKAAGVPVARLDAETAPSAGLVVDPRERAVRISGRWISPTVTWLRHFSHRAMPPGRGPLRRAFAADSWHALVHQLGVFSDAVITDREPGLLAQLAAARACGVAVPATVVTTDPGQAASLLPGSRLVVKALHRHFVEARPGLLYGVFPEIIDRAELGRIKAGPAGSPVVVQEHIDHDSEIRVYHVDGQVAAAFAITKSGPSAPWLNAKAVTARQVELPDAVAGAASALAAAMSMDYGALDFLVTGDVPVFLEANFAGDWRWLEAKVRAAPVTTAVAAMLRARHERAIGASSVNPVTFLSHGIVLTTVDKDERPL